MRTRLVLALTLTTVLAATVAQLAPLASASTAGATASTSRSTDYLVLFEGTRPTAAAREAIARSGGTITEVNTKIGYAYVRTRSAAFSARLNASGAVLGVAEERSIGSVPRARRLKVSDARRLTRQGGVTRTEAAVPLPKVSAAEAGVTPEPLANLQWDMRQIGATPAGSYAVSTGSRKVRIGVIDTGIDGSHPDIAPSFNRRLSRNFVTDMVDIDGPCEHPGCVDPVDEDDDGHGTHVASTIGSPINGLGMAGVAPNVTLVNIRAGQDSGYFFLKATLDALTYAGDIGVDVVNMSYYTDPWLYNCVDNPADSPAEQAEQRVLRLATQRALDYAMRRNVLPVAAMGNGATDLGRPTTDATSPDYPANSARERAVDNSCITVPTESRGVVAVSSTGPSMRKAYYSDYGTEQTDVSAPGGDTYDSPDNTRSAKNAIIAAYPRSLAEANGDLNPDGTPKNDFVLRDCKGDVCGYYQYLQGTSMASPHAVGVAALVASEHGHRDRVHGGLTLRTDRARRLLYGTTLPHPCPRPRLFHYTRITVDGVVESDARCEGPLRRNGFYGRGIVNAYRAVTR